MALRAADTAGRIGPAALLAAALVSACYGGQPAGSGSACKLPELPCRQYFACLDGRCQPMPPSMTGPGAGADGGSTAETAPTGDGGPDQDVVAVPGADAGGDRGLDAVMDAPAPLAADAVPPYWEPASSPKVYVFSLTANGGVWMQASSLGSDFVHEKPWSDARDVETLAGPIDAVDEVEAQANGPHVTLFARTGTRVHEAQLGAGGWTRWRPVAEGASGMGLANVQGVTWTCLIGPGGNLLLGRQLPSGVWSPFDDVAAQALEPDGQGDRPGPLAKIDCTGLGANIEIVALDARGRLWHAARKPDGWTRFRRVSTALDHVFLDVDSVASGGALHVLGSVQQTQLHAARSADGVWAEFRDIEFHTGFDPGGTVIAGSEASAFTEVLWFQLNHLGELWVSVRYRLRLVQYERIDTAVNGRPPLVNVAATVGHF